MKKVIFLLSWCSLIIYPQSFHSLDGFENQTGETLLLYRLGSDYFPYNPVYKLNTTDLSEELIIEAYNNYFPGGQLAKAVWDFEFFPDKTNFMNVGYQINPDNHSYIARNDSIVFGGIGGYDRVDISKQDPLKIFAFVGGPVARSFDGGFTFPMDSLLQITDYYPVSLADFDDNILFGISYDNQLVKNSEIVDTAKVFFDQYTKVLYDVNQFHIYCVNKTYGGYTLNVSNNKGNAFTWTKTYQSDNPFFITIDSEESGIVFLADGRRIYKSTNNGYSFTLYKNLSSKIVGVYKKPGSEVLYAATMNAIYKVTSDSITIIKSLPISPDEFKWFPLAIGNTWVYSSYIRHYNPYGPPSSQFVGTKYMNVAADTTIDGKIYFVLENDLLNQFVFEPRMFIRVDSISGLIYRYWDDLDNEFLFHNMNAELGDTIYYPLNPEQPYYILWQEHENLFLNETRKIREYFEYAPCGCFHFLVKGLGLGYTVFDEFGGAEDNLKGAVINGIVYGDTSLVVSVDDDDETIPKEFALHQNYPNPFNPSTKISWQSPVGSHQTLKVFDVLGREVATLVDGYREAGYHEVEFQSSVGSLQLASGIYYYQLKAGKFVETRKMIYLK